MKQGIRDFIENGGDFESIALDLYTWQRANNPEYDRFCGEVTVRNWTEIPAVPTTLFQDLTFTCFPTDEATTIFHTSGTTGSQSGVIHLCDTEIYDLSARRHAEACLGPLPTKGISLVPTSAHSSLGHMCNRFVPNMPSFFSAERGTDAEGAWQAIRDLAKENLPVFIPGTAFALADLLDHGADPVQLAPGSIVMVTGGFKGKRTTIPSAILHSNLERCLPGGLIVSEYGMSELASQLWAIPASAKFKPPPWLRVVAVDPWTGAPATRGLLRFFDLANHQTVLAIETQDVGTVHADGRVQLEGRLASAQLRGCSLTAENTRD